MVHKNPPHDLGGYRHKMSVPPPAIPPLTGKPQEGFVHQGGSLKTVSEALAPQVGSREAPEFRINPLHQAHLGFAISLTHQDQQVRYRFGSCLHSRKLWIKLPRRPTYVFNRVHFDLIK